MPAMCISLSACLRGLGTWLLILTIASSCQKNDDSVAQPRTVADLIQEDDQFSLLRAAVAHAGVGDALKGANLTLFAPNDAAFGASGLPTPAAITALPKEQVRNLLIYHVLTASVGSSALPAGLNPVQTANQGVAYVNRTGNGAITINSARVTQADLTTANGTVHIIDRVLTPSAATVLAVIQNHPDLTFLSAALRRVGTTNTTLTALGDPSTNRVTLFAPSDAAFRSAGYASVSAVETANPQTLASLLTYHLLSGVTLSQQIQAGAVGTLSGNNRLTLAVTNGAPTVKGAKNATPAALLMPDLVAPNGVVHVINQVLQP